MNFNTLMISELLKIERNLKMILLVPILIMTIIMLVENYLSVISRIP